MRSTHDDPWMRGVAALLMTLLLGACTSDDPDPAADAAAQTEQAPDAEPPAAPTQSLAKVCEKAFNLIDNNEPGTVPRKKAVALANEAFFADDSVPVTEAFSNLNNVYVFDDGTSSETEVRSQLHAICS